MSVPCELCDAKCCKNYDVFIDHEDLNILDDHSHIKKIEYNKDYGYVPTFILWENSKKKKWVLCLNNPDNICQFLENDKCSIYNQRPLICKTYPHYVDKGKIKSMKNLCPLKWSLNEVQENEIRQNYEQLLVNFLAFETICDEWNSIVKKDNSLKDFLHFVKNYKF